MYARNIERVCACVCERERERESERERISVVRGSSIEHFCVVDFDA